MGVAAAGGRRGNDGTDKPSETDSMHPPKALCGCALKSLGLFSAAEGLGVGVCTTPTAPEPCGVYQFGFLPEPMKGLSDSQVGPSHLEPGQGKEESELLGLRRGLPASDKGSYQETKEERHLMF